MEAVLSRSGAVLALALALVVGGCGGGSGTASDTTVGPKSPAPAQQEDKRGEASIEGFGSTAGGDDREEILAAFDGYLDSLAGKNYPGACSYLSGAVHTSLSRLAGEGSGETGCSMILPEILSATATAVAREQANGHVSKVRVEGDGAFVIFKAPGAELYQLPMLREGPHWKVATVSSSILVPSAATLGR